MVKSIYTEGAFKTDGHWWEKKTTLRYTTNTFNILFSQTLTNNAKRFYIVTYNIKDVEVLNKFSKKESYVFVNSRFESDLIKLKSKYPMIRFFHNPSIHLKLYMNDSGKVVFGSQNFNCSKWIEGLWEIKDMDFFNLMMEKNIIPLIDNSKEVTNESR